MITAADILSPAFLRGKRLELEELEGKCHALWLYSKNETEEWNGDGCDCKCIQGNLVCRRQTLEEEIERHTHINTGHI